MILTGLPHGDHTHLSGRFEGVVMRGKQDLASDGIDVVNRGLGGDSVLAPHQARDGVDDVHSPLLLRDYVVEDVDEGGFVAVDVEVVEHLDGTDLVRHGGAGQSADPGRVPPSGHSRQILAPIDMHVDMHRNMSTYEQTCRHKCRHVDMHVDMM
jgi:hypothetical protein